MTSTQRRLLVVFGVMVGLLAAASVAYACGIISTVKLDKEQAAPGETVTGQGDVFREGEGFNEPEVRWGSRDGQLLWTGPVGEDRTIHIEFEVPDVEPGHYMVIASQTDAEGNPVAGSPARTTIEVTDGGAAASGAAATRQSASGEAAGAAAQQEAGASEAAAAPQGQEQADAEAATAEPQPAGAGEPASAEPQAAAADAAQPQAAASSAAPQAASEQQAAAAGQQAAATQQQAAASEAAGTAAASTSPEAGAQPAVVAAQQAADAARFATAEREAAAAPVSQAAGAAELAAAERSTSQGLSAVAAWTAVTAAWLDSAEAADFVPAVSPPVGAVDGTTVAWALAGALVLAMAAVFARRHRRRALGLAVARLW